jgi:hypothetical protein
MINGEIMGMAEGIRVLQRNFSWKRFVCYKLDVALQESNTLQLEALVQERNTWLIRVVWGSASDIHMKGSVYNPGTNCCDYCH